jgi:[acyl-carrier-protein] S-malonyltransferase
MLTLLCSGQGRQHAGMFDLTGDVAAAADLFEHARRLLGNDPRSWIRTASRDALSDNRTAQILCTLQAVSAAVALADIWPEQRCVAGYSVGEVAAWHVAGLLAADDALDLIAERARIMEAARISEQGMLSIRGLAQPVVEDLCASREAAIAIVNPGNVFVLGGERSALHAIADAAIEKHAERVVPVDVKIASHTYLLKEASQAFRATLAALKLKEVPLWQTRLFSGVDGSAVLSPAQGLEKLALQLSHPIQWAACLEACVEAGSRAFLELGPGRALTDMVASTYPHLAARSLDDFHSLHGVRDWLRRVLETD